MSVRSTRPQPPPAAFPRPGTTPGGPPQQSTKKESAKAESGKSSPQTGGASGKAGAKGKGAPTGGTQGQEGLAAGRFDGPRDKHEQQGRPGLERLQGGGTHAPPYGQERSAQQAPAPVAPELPQQRKTTERESTPSERTAAGGRAKLRGVVMERLLNEMKDAHERLTHFAKNPGRLGVVNLSMTLAESAVTHILWKEPSTIPARRVSLLNILGLPPSTSDATMVRELMGEVRQAFMDFQASKPGIEAWHRYDEVLQRYESMGVQPVVPGHDTGPMLAELQRLNLPQEPDFTRSILMHPLLVGVALSPDEGDADFVMVAGLSVADLGALVAHMRRLNPRLTNKLVRQLLFLATSDKKRGVRKQLGDPDLKNVQELAKQLLRLQVTHQLFV
ncbi:hypothetical protein BO221_42105 [Archangium sp. Cb G35]|uniref:hypothetical protein n=1 Tax=Archangium sp. Cb G35 TaxID=1920190 RepID=UPI000935E106|nr:hypothetical protein [Archangium sp. Cb G35]OJT18088.1 hypothetical protein BO221_42105 [Archangium sp. Cb G35]